MRKKKGSVRVAGFAGCMRRSRRLVYKRRHADRHSRPPGAGRGPPRRAAVARRGQPGAGAAARRVPLAGGAHRGAQPAARRDRGAAARLRGVPGRRTGQHQRDARSQRQGPGTDAFSAALARKPLPRPPRRLRPHGRGAGAGVRVAAPRVGNPRRSRPLGDLARPRRRAGRRRGAVLRHDAGSARAGDRGNGRAVPAGALDGGDPGDRRRPAGRSFARQPGGALQRRGGGTAAAEARRGHPHRLAAVRGAGRRRIFRGNGDARCLWGAAGGSRLVRFLPEERLSTDARRLARLPAWLWLALAVALACQVGVRATDLPPPPSPQALRLASFGEPQTLARLAMLYLQAFDLGANNALSYQQLDYPRLIGWLRAILALDPRSDYPLFSAARVYAEVGDPVRSRLMLEFIHEQYLLDPDRRWPWLAHAALLAKHRLHDLPLARRYAAAIDRHTQAADVPLWARQMEVFILE